MLAVKGGVMKRGQAFETMMLVISVIVALAILAVLMGILGNLGTQFGSDPKTVMRDGLREVSSKGYGLLAAKKATFEKGDIILKKDVIGDTPIQPVELKFFGASTLAGSSCPTGTGGTANSLSIASGDSITVCSKVEAYISVCGDGSKISNPLYCIAISRQPGGASGAATDLCKSSCGLT